LIPILATRHHNTSGSSEESGKSGVPVLKKVRVIPSVLDVARGELG